MMKKNKLILIVLCSILWLTPCFTFAKEKEPTETPNTEESQETSKETNKKEETEEKETKITLDFKTLDLTVGDHKELKVSGNGDSKVEWSTNNDDVATVKDGKVSATGVGTAVITAKVGKQTVTCKVTVIAKKEEITEPKSSDATLKDVKIENGKLDKKFKADVYEYTITLDSTLDKLVLTPVKNDEKAKETELKTDSSITIVVTAEDGKTTKSYKFIIAKEEISLNLSKLAIDGYSFNEAFESGKDSYTATIPYEIELVTVIANPEAGDKVKVTVDGGSNLRVGQNQIKITVKDNDNNSKEYKIIVTRSEKAVVEENPTSIITSELIESHNSGNTVSSFHEDSDDGGSFLKYFIVSIACFILFAIGGIGIYFYIQTSPKKLKKLKNKMIQQETEEEESPMVAVQESQEDTQEEQASVIEIFDDDDLMATKEYNRDHLETLQKELDDFLDQDDE